jgi:hypothetical protein
MITSFNMVGFGDFKEKRFLRMDSRKKQHPVQKLLLLTTASNLFLIYNHNFKCRVKPQGRHIPQMRSLL